MNRYRSTVVTPVPSRFFFPLRTAVAQALPNLRWRHHQRFGMLQAYLYEGGSEETRVHIWHPRLRDDSLQVGNVHDHRFDMESIVLLGSIQHNEYHLTPSPEGKFERFSIQNARKGEAPIRTTGERYDAKIVQGVITEGHLYEFPKWDYHGSGMTDLCVTLVAKYAQEERPASLLALAGQVPAWGVAAEGSTPPELIQTYVELARTRLLTPFSYLEG